MGPKKEEECLWMKGILKVTKKVKSNKQDKDLEKEGNKPLKFDTVNWGKHGLRLNVTKGRVA